MQSARFVCASAKCPSCAFGPSRQYLGHRKSSWVIYSPSFARAHQIYFQIVLVKKKKRILLKKEKKRKKEKVATHLGRE
jgi:hypothetical protein